MKLVNIPDKLGF